MLVSILFLQNVVICLMYEHHHLLRLKNKQDHQSPIMEGTLKRRVRSPDATRERDPNGFHVNDMVSRVRCDERDQHGHLKKPKGNKSFALRSLCLILFAAIVVMIGREYMERYVHHSHIHASPSSSYSDIHKEQGPKDDNIVGIPHPPKISHPDDHETETKKSRHKHDHDGDHHHNSHDKPKIRTHETSKEKNNKKKKKHNNHGDSTTSTSEEDNKKAASISSSPKFGKMNHGLYRFKAEQLGKHFLKAIDFFDEWIGQEPHAAGAAFAQERVKLPGVSDYHQECFDVPDSDKMLALEQRKKKHSQKGISRLEFLEEEHQFFYDVAGYKQEELVHITENRQWAWRTAALFSAQYSGTQSEFRDQINGIIGNDRTLSEMLKVTGTFWYPPNAIREWHTNAWDVGTDKETGKMKKPWRMYFVRQKPVEAGDDVQDKSGFHLVDGNGISHERLGSVGAYQLSHHDDGQPNVWRVPDQNGYVTLFRLQVEEPYRWHCIVADETVHRYSLGMSLSDDDVEVLLQHVGVDY